MKSRCCTVESLESRTLFSAVMVVNHVLSVMGDCNVSNAIVVNNSADGASVDVSLSTVNKRGVPRTVLKSFPSTLGITSVRIVGGKMDDDIRVGQTGPAFTLGVKVNAKAGNDIVITGDGDDTIVCGPGGDEVVANGGNDRVYGGADDDSLDGGAGDDILWGGKGDDVVKGGAGNDLLGGVLGTNFMIGGEGQDQFVTTGLMNQQSDDFDAATDLLTLVAPKDDGNVPPVV